MRLIQHWRHLQSDNTDGNVHYRHGLGLPIPDDLDPLNDDLIRQLRSHYAIAYSDDKKVDLIVDQMRSFPLYYAILTDNVVVSDDPYWIANEFSLPIAQDNYQLAKEAGFTWTDQTFYRGLHQVPPGCRISISLTQGKVSKTVIHQPFFLNERTSDSEQEFTNRLSTAFDTVMWRAVKACGQSHILVPLSGGLDSRLIVTWLARNKISNVLCFTYGRHDSREIGVSKEIAERLGLPWTAVYLEDDSVKEAWEKPETADFLKYCSAATSLPHIQDWYALLSLLRQGIITEGDVVFPGHTIVDNFHNFELLNHLPVDKRQIISAVTEKHWVMKPTDESEAGKALFRAKVNQFLLDNYCDGTRNNLQRCIEGLNFYTRQTMYINNSVRAYEYFGLRWAIPMLDREFTDTWCSAPADYTLTRKVYGDWIQKGYQAQTGVEASLYTTVPKRFPKPIMKLAKSISDSLGITALINRYYSTKVSLHHPMGFDLYYGDTTLIQRIRPLLLGGSSISIWNTLFLKDRWHHKLRLFHKPE